MRIVAEQLSPAGRLQVNTALLVMEALDEHLGRLRQRIVATARHVAGARALMDAIYGVGGDDQPGAGVLARRRGPLLLFP